MTEDYKTITKKDISEWGVDWIGDCRLDYLVEILNGTYPLDKAREDVLSFRKET